jgi:lipoate-protein ligase A
MAGGLSHSTTGSLSIQYQFVRIGRRKLVTASIRLIVDPPAGGAWNMSLDEALLHQVSSGESPDTLRFYQWNEPTLSLGYFQSIRERQGHLASLNCPVVRRSSGGGAIVHDVELTYSLAMRVANRFAARQLYDALHKSLLAVLDTWSIRAELFGQSERNPGAEASRGTDINRAAFLCFQRRTPGDVIFREFKICGSAQRRLGHAVLQHGSLLLGQSPSAPELPGIRELRGGNGPNAASLIDPWKMALEAELGCIFVSEGGWRPPELVSANHWLTDRFANSEWNLKR